MADKKDVGGKGGAKAKGGAKKASSPGKKAKAGVRNGNPFTGEWSSLFYREGTVIKCKFTAPHNEDDEGFCVRDISSATQVRIKHSKRRRDPESIGLTGPSTINFRRKESQDKEIAYSGVLLEGFPKKDVDTICGKFHRIVTKDGVKRLDDSGDWLATRPPMTQVFSEEDEECSSRPAKKAAKG